MAIVSAKDNCAFQLKGSLFTITALQLFDADEENFKAQLDKTLSQAPKFFENAPIVIDLNEFETSDTPINFAGLISMMRAAKLIPFGVRGGDAAVQKQAIDNGLAILHNSLTQNAVINNKEKIEKIKKTVEKTKDVVPALVSTKVITQPVRSGQQIYAKNSDLIILSAVSHGAEILADGHIHVYGPLRGRALAGVMGNTEARIFCHSLEADLISIAGRYLVNEQLETYKELQDLQIYLEEEHIKVAKLA